VISSIEFLMPSNIWSHSMKRRTIHPKFSLLKDSAPTSDSVDSSCLMHRSESVAETEDLGRMAGQSARGGEVIALYGELGTGKTAFVRGMAAGLGVPTHAVNSPTFVLVHEYQGRLPLIHIDLYRLQEARDLRHLGLEEYFNDRVVVAMEWAERAAQDLPADRLETRLVHEGGTTRSISMLPTGNQARRLLNRMIRHDAKGQAHHQAMGERPQKPTAHSEKRRQKGLRP
jgi:tRNA threonylcarbamoyladenosine biosynthesis protein TsaE